MNKNSPTNQSGGGVSSTMPRDTAQNWVDANQASLTALSDRIWELAELGLQENESARLQEDYLRRQGFSVESGVAGMPSAFVATYVAGTGQPVIGFLGEYDALPGLSQKPVPHKDPIEPGAPGHGCGHNLLGVAALAAAVAMKEAAVAGGLSATIKYFGCPAEETLIGKVFMVRDGCMNGLDACLTWHPGSTNSLWSNSSLAMNSVKFNFYGRTAHAAGDPQNGRSALDAVELMNIGANYLREHVTEKTRIHYATTEGGGQPNVVPAKAQVWYYVRAPLRQEVEETFERLVNIARGATLMTDTTFDMEFVAGCYNFLPNRAMGRLVHENMKVIGAPKFTDEELNFAAEMEKSFPANFREVMMRDPYMPKELADQKLNETVLPLREDMPPMAGSTDVGDVSWVAPTVQFSTACSVIGTPGHSWQECAASGMSIGHKGMLMAAKVLAVSALDLVLDPAKLEEARAEFGAATVGQPYKAPLPEGARPPLGLLNKAKRA